MNLKNAELKKKKKDYYSLMVSLQLTRKRLERVRIKLKKKGALTWKSTKSCQSKEASVREAREGAEKGGQNPAV